MRAALSLAAALAAVAATSLVGLGTAAPAEATTCQAHAPGVTISHLERHGNVSCEEAKTLVHHALRGTEHQVHWTCSHYGSHHIPYSCWASGHRFVTFFVVVGDGTGPGGF